MHTICQVRARSAVPRGVAGRGHAPGRLAAKSAAVKTPSSATASNLLDAIKECSKILPDSTLSPDRYKDDATTSNAVVNVALLSHILANTSAFYDFAVRKVSLYPVEPS
jgi:hypothetical protein